MKSLKEFIKELVCMMYEKTKGENTIVYYSGITDENGLNPHVITITRNHIGWEKSFNAESLYKHYQMGMQTETMVSVLLDLPKIKDRKDEEKFIGFLNNVENFNQIKDCIMVEIIPFEVNREYLKDKIYFQYLDFAVCFFIIIRTKEEYFFTLSLSKYLLSIWKVSKQKLRNIAVENMEKKLPVEIMSMEEVIRTFSKNAGESNPIKNIRLSDESQNAYVMTNSRRIFGATAILYHRVLKDFAYKQKVEEVYVLPSSVHEVILFPIHEKTKISKNVLNCMLNVVNETFSDKSEILSDHIYIYKRDEDIMESVY